MGFLLTTILDSVSGRNMTVVYTPEDRKGVIPVWEQTDVLLQDIQNLAPFKGRTRWCDLEPTHFKFLLTRAIERVFDLLNAQQDDIPDHLNDHSVINTMNFLLMAYAHSYELGSDSQIETIRVTRHSVNEITIMVSAFVDSNFRRLSPASKASKTSPTFMMITNEEDDT